MGGFFAEENGSLSMRRYWLAAHAFSTETVLIEGEELHHIRDVCRQDLGSKFEVLNGQGQAFFVEVIESKRKHLIAKILETREIPELARPHLELVLCVPRFPVLEAILEKAVELGVNKIHLAYSDFSFIRNQDKTIAGKWERWQKIIKSATQQSGRGRLMELVPPQPLDYFFGSINRDSGELGLFAYEGEGMLHLKQALKEQRVDSGAKEMNKVWVFVGAEGGFSDKEVATFVQKDLKPVTLGAQVLRVETACVALISVIKYEFDLMQ